MTTNEGKIARLMAENETLKEEVRQLKDALTPDENSISWRYGLTKTQMAMFKRLEQSEIASREALLDVVQLTNGTPSNEKSLDTMICYMRKRLRGSCYSIRTVWGVGYRLEGPERTT